LPAACSGRLDSINQGRQVSLIKEWSGPARTSTASGPATPASTPCGRPQSGPESSIPPSLLLGLLSRPIIGCGHKDRDSPAYQHACAARDERIEAAWRGSTMSRWRNHFMAGLEGGALFSCSRSDGFFTCRTTRSPSASLASLPFWAVTPSNPRHYSEPRQLSLLASGGAHSYAPSSYVPPPKSC
jgi:hypothetical protein